MFWPLIEIKSFNVRFSSGFIFEIRSQDYIKKFDGINLFQIHILLKFMQVLVGVSVTPMQRKRIKTLTTCRKQIEITIAMCVFGVAQICFCNFNVE